MIVIIMGPAGSGKSTQAELLAQEFGAIHLNTGDLLYYASQGDAPEARTIKEEMDNGEIVDDNIVTQLVAKHLDEHKGEDFVVEGFPRTLSQAKESGIVPDKAFYLKLSDEVAKERLMERERKDDTPELIEKRLKLYHEETEPILEYYKSLEILEEIDGEREVAEIAQEIAQKTHV